MKRLATFVSDMKGTPSNPIYNKACGEHNAASSIESKDDTIATNKTVDGSFSAADKIPDNPFKVKDESIEINCPIKVDGEVLEIDLSRLDEEEKKQFDSLLKKIQKTKVWKPEKGEKYYVIENINEIYEYIWDNGSIDESIYSLGRCYRTRIEAEFALGKLKVETEIKRYIEEHDPVKIDWKDKKQHKHYLTYNTSIDRIEPKDCMVVISYGTIYFSTKLDWYKMITTIGIDRIKKYIFGVE